MGQKKVVPKKLGTVRIPKRLRKIGNKALANPEVAGIVSGALASVAALVAARGVAKHVPGGDAAAHAIRQSTLAKGIGSVVKQAFSDILAARSSAGRKASGKDKSRSAESTAASVAEGPSKGQDSGRDRRH
jgi:hypothetical protein